MFQWLTTKLFRPYTVYDLIEELNPGYGARLTRRFEQHDEEEKHRHAKEAQARLEQERTDPYYARRESRRKRELLELKLEDAEWILEHEKRLATLQKKLCGNDHRPNNMGPTPTACGDWNTTSQGFGGAAPSFVPIKL